MEGSLGEKLTFFAALFQVDENAEAGMRLLYLTVFILSIIVYKLGFAKKLSLLKNVVIYFCMALGCTIFTFFAVFLPITEALFITAIFLGIYRFRLHLHRKSEKSA